MKSRSYTFSFKNLRFVRAAETRLFAVKLTSFLLIAFIFQVVLASQIPELYSGEEIKLLDKHLAERVDIVYFGDSTVTYYSDQDENKKDLAEMLQDMLPAYTVGRVSHPAYQMDAYLQYCKYIAKQKYHPKVIIIPINMRSFSPEWNMRPAYQFEAEKLLLAHDNSWLVRAFYRPLSILHFFTPEISEADFQETLVFNGNNPVGRVKDYENSAYLTYSQEKMKSKLIFFYMYSLTKEHRKVKSMLEIADAVNESDIQVLFYISPIDYQTGEKYLGSQFKERITENSELIHSLLSGKGIAVQDLSCALGTDYFDWNMYPNEHLDESGRRFVAERLSMVIREVLK